MLPLLFELLNHLHKRPFQLGKGINMAGSSLTKQQERKGVDSHPGSAQGQLNFTVL
jgi:hypothetical protein